MYKKMIILFLMMIPIVSGAIMESEEYYIVAVNDVVSSKVIEDDTYQLIIKEGLQGRMTSADDTVIEVLPPFQTEDLANEGQTGVSGSSSSSSTDSDTTTKALPDISVFMSGESDYPYIKCRIQLENKEDTTNELRYSMYIADEAYAEDTQLGNIRLVLESNKRYEKEYEVITNETGEYYCNAVVMDGNGNVIEEIYEKVESKKENALTRFISSEGSYKIIAIAFLAISVIAGIFIWGVRYINK